MHDIASQLVLKWARQGPEHKIQATEDFSRLTLDTIALCAMDFRFNSFYQEDMHPYVKAMNHTLSAANNSRQLSGLITRLLPSHKQELKQSEGLLESTQQELVRYRREYPTEKKDLLNSLIHGKDPKTGKQMRDKLIAANMQTFLIAGLCILPSLEFRGHFLMLTSHTTGHETTSGLLSFAFCQLLKNPRAYYAAQAEVDRVLGHARIEPKHINELKYVHALLRETLRLTPTAPAFMRAVRPENTEETVYIGSKDPQSTRKYAIPRGKPIICLLGKIQKDPKVWGDDADEFKPERMLDEAFEKLPQNAWKPFGTGMRACIGRAFAWQEAVLAVALILQSFDLRLDDPNYEMKIVQMLTIKPKDFYMRASLRKGITPTMLMQRLGGDLANGSGVNGSDGVAQGVSAAADRSHELSILYGSNTGTCQALAQKLAAQCAQKGLKAEVTTLDQAVDQVPNKTPMVIITASYEGQPTDDAARFVAWLASLDGEADGRKCEGVRYAVFGCGHSDWASTYQRVPKRIDELLSRHGAENIVERGSSDVSKSDTFGDFEAWASGHLWPALDAHLHSPGRSADEHRTIPTLEVELTAQERAARLQQNVQWANVVSNTVLTAPGEPEKRHIEIELPSDLTYTAGDYLAVLPLNPREYVRRVMTHFNLPWDGQMTIKPGSATSLPTGKPVGIFDLLQGYVEVSQPATKQDLEVLASVCSNKAVQTTLTDLMKPEPFSSEIIDKRITILDLLLKHSPAIPLPFGTYLSLLPPMRTRHYSISSSPLASPHSVALTYVVLDAPAWYQPGGNAEQLQRFQGVAGSYMRSLAAGDRVLVSVRGTNKYLRLPADQGATPIVMFANGTGIAPFRGFVQERATLMREGGKKLAPAVLFAGCRRPGRDQLYAAEFEEWARLGAVDMRWVFSRDAGAGGCKYVQDRMFKDKEDIGRMWQDDARFYICGSKSLVQGIGVTTRSLFMEAAEEEGREVAEEDVNSFVLGLRNERFVTDVF